MKNLVQSFYDWYRLTLRNTKYRWLIILGTLAYLFSPLDIAPDFIPIIGWIDDTVIVTLLVTEVSQLLIERLNTRKTTPTDLKEDVASSAPTDVVVDVTPQS